MTKMALRLTFILAAFVPSLLMAQGARYEFAAPDLATLKKYIPVGKNSFTADEIDKLIKDLAAKRDLEMIRMASQDNKVYVEIREISGQHKFEVVGNQALTTPEIMTILGVNRSERLNKFEVQKNIPRLRERYDAVGMKKVDINFKETGEGSNLTYVVEINEGSTTKLEEIVVLSPNSFLNNYIKYKLLELVGKKIDREVIKKIEGIVNEILIKNRILDAKIAKISPVYNQNRTAARLTITLETTSTYEFLFYGNEYFSDGNIISHLDIDKNFLNYIKNRKLFVKNIELHYRTNGFPRATVEPETIYYEKLNKYILKFNIKEGVQYRIKDINVSGKISRSPAYYEDLIRSNLSDLKNSNLFVEENITKAVDKMVTDLKDQGFLRAEKISIEYVFNKTSTVDIQLQINENILTQIRSINFSGLKSFTASQLFDIIDLRPNSPLNLVKVYNSYGNIKTFYQKNGYLEIDITTPPDKLIKYVDNYEFADITYTFKEGPQIRVKDLQTRGNDFTKDKVILRELDLAPGEVLTSDKVSDSIVFLERTQLFSRAQINTSDSNSPVVDRTVFVDVQEKAPGLFSSGVGVSNERDVTLRGYLGLAYRNLGGTGRGISGRGDIKYSVNKDIQYPENRIVLGYYEPYLFFNRLRARIGVIRQQEVFDIDLLTKKVVIEESNEINFTLEKQVNRRLKLSWRLWEFSNLTYFDKDSDNDTSSVDIASVGPLLEYDRRDDTFVPRDGTYSVAQMDYAAPFLGSTSDAANHIEFFRITAGHTIYTPLVSSKRWVLVNDIRGGYIDNLADLNSKPQSGVPATRLVFLGGRSTLRGFDLRNNERVPSLREICPAPLCTTIEDYKMRTSSYFYLLKNELRFPLYGDLGGLVFYDGGAVFIENTPMLDHYRDTAGFGARYITPIGAFTLEIGFKLDKKRESQFYAQESPFTIHISMGSF